MIWSGRVRNERPHEKSDPANTIGGLAHGVQVYVPGAFQPGEIKNSEGFLDAMSLLLSPRLGVSLELGESIQKSVVASLRVQPFRVFRFGPQAGKFIYEIPGRPYGLMARNLYMLRRLRPPAVLVEGPISIALRTAPDSSPSRAARHLSPDRSRNQLPEEFVTS